MEIPNSFYVIAGTLIVANLGTIFSLIYGVGRLVWFIAQLESRVEKLENDFTVIHEDIRSLRVSHTTRSR